MAQSHQIMPGTNLSFERRGGQFISYKIAVALVIIFFAVLILVFFLGRLSNEQKVDDAPTTEQAIEPLHYTLELNPILNNHSAGLEQFSYSGKVEILLKIREKTNNVQIHSRHLHILYHHTILRRVTDKNEKPNFETMSDAELVHNVKIWKSFTSNSLKLDLQELNPTKEKVIIHSVEALEKGHIYLLSIQFRDKIREGAIGWYRTNYVDKDNQSRWIVASQFEPNNARQAFPCFGVPDLKALFSVTVYQPKGYKAFSNMDVKDNRIDEQSGGEIVEFNTTPNLSPYLVSVILMKDYVSHTPEDKENLWTQAALATEAEYARVIARKLFVYFQTYLNNTLPLDRIDIVGIPDYSLRGTESFGLIALEESMLLYNQQNSSLSQFEKMSLHLGFHVAQQWFSNMITPGSWNILWLRESFGKYLSYMALKEIEGHEHLSDRFVVNELQKSLFADSLPNTQPLFQLSLQRPEDIRLFNYDIVYTKGGCLLRMLNHFIGDINFQQGLQEYVKKWYLKTVTPTNLWESFDTTINKLNTNPLNDSVNEIMMSWVHNKGYPLVKVFINRNLGVATFSQEPYSITGDIGQEEWYIPVSFTTKEEMDFKTTKPKLWLTSRVPKKVELATNDTKGIWILANTAKTGYFRVNYDNISWQVLLEYLATNYNTIPPLSRYQLVDDAFSLAYAGRLHYTIPLELSSLVAKFENDLIPWEGLLKHINFLEGIFVQEAPANVFKSYVTSLLKRISKETAQNKETTVHTQENEHLFHLVMAPLCRADEQECRQWASKNFRENSKIIYGDTRGTLYSVIGGQGIEADWMDFWNKISDPGVDPREKLYIAEGLASTPNLTTIEGMLTKLTAENDSIIHKTVKVEIWQQLGLHMKNLDALLGHLRKLWEPLYFKLQYHNDLLHRLVEGVGQKLSTDQHRRSVQELSNYHRSICEKEDASLFHHLIEEINLKISIRESHEQHILRWMDKYNATNAESL